MIEKIIDTVRHLPGVYQFRKKRYIKKLLTHADYYGFWGAYSSMEEARKAAGSYLQSWDQDELVDMNVESFSSISLFDYPVIMWMSRILKDLEIKSLIDFGGHIGVKYYAYLSMLEFREEFKWTVVDVEALINAGAKIAEQRNATNLKFAADTESAGEADVLFASGSIMYSENNIEQVVSSMTKKPRYIIVNKVGVVEGLGFVTLETFRKMSVPFRIFNKDGFEKSITDMGYQKLDGWEIKDREMTVPYLPEPQLVKSIGSVWEFID